MLTSLTLMALYVAIVALAAARNEIADLRRRVTRLDDAPAPVERTHTTELPRWLARELAEPPGPARTVVVARNDFAHLIPLAGPEWRDGPAHPVSWPVGVRPDGSDHILTSVARGYDEYTQNRDTKQMAAISG